MSGEPSWARSPFAASRAVVIGIWHLPGPRYLRDPFLPMKFYLLPFILLAALPHTAPAQTAYAIADGTTGLLLESSSPTKKLQIGSLTKIATAMVVLDWADAHGHDLSQSATVPNTAANLGTQGSVGFTPGDRCSLRDLLYAALMQSDNQAAETLADHVGRALGRGGELSPVDQFVAQMNALARRLGMTRTRCLNPPGLDSAERSLPYSTAEDLAKLTTYAMANSAFRFYVSQKERKIAIESVNGGASGYLVRTTNELLGTNNIDGVKTGMTRRAGQCVIVSAARAPESRQEGERVVVTPRRIHVVVLGAQDRFGAAAGLLARGWSDYAAWAAAGRPMKGWKAPR